MTCEDIVRAAQAALPAVHPSVERVDVGYGRTCEPVGISCPVATPIIGRAIFTFANGAELTIVVREDERTGSVRVIEVEPLPTR